MPSSGSRLRVGAVLAVAALALHQLRYLLSYGEHSGEELAAQGHSYLDVAGLVVVALVGLASLELLVRIARAASAPADAPPPLMLRLWALSTASLLGVYGAQEWIEGVVHAGHPSGFDALVGHGGWIAVFLAGGFGALVAMALRGAEAVVRRAAKHRKRPFAGTRPVGQRFPRTPPRGALDPVPRFLAARGPPLTSV